MKSKGILFQGLVFLLLTLGSFSPRAMSQDTSPRLIRGPYLQVATSSSILIRWRTDGTAQSRVRYGAEAGHLNGVADDSSWVTEHQVMLRGLRPHTRYYYSIGGKDDT